jgi:hypothetical protein
MKALALLLIICIVTLSALPVRAVAVQHQLKKECCQKMPAKAPCNQSNNDCNGLGNCNTMLSCSGCGFLVVEPVAIATMVPIITAASLTLHSAGNVSGFSLSSWHPPKV